MKVVQCSLRSMDNNSVAHMVCWLDKRPELKKGVRVTLKDYEEPDREWWVESIGDVVMEKSDLKRAKDWHRNDFVRDKGSFRNVRT